MIYEFLEHESLKFKVIAPMYLPFYNRWNENAYYKYEPFQFDPFEINCSSTSGSPVLLGGGSFFGFLNENGGSFDFDGAETLTVYGKPGQKLYYAESCDPYDEWLKYNDVVLASYQKKTNEPFWSMLEYCTWVDQKKEASVKGIKDVHDPLTEKYVYEYMDRVEKLGLPKGKLTIDDGWYVRKDPDGNIIYGDWEIDRAKFPNMEKLVSDMTKRGFIPGLWFAPFNFTPNCALAKKYPNLMGNVYSQNNELGLKWVFIRPDNVLEEYYNDIFTKYVKMGFKKFKLDIAYGNKQDMKKLLKMMYGIIKRLDPTIEIECHIPDIFVSRYCDTVRINDVSFDEKGLWRGTAMEHYKVCLFSSSDKILNLDHLGTNTPVPSAKNYLEHTKLMLKLKGGYPCVSLLPDLFDEEVRNEFIELVCNWCKQNKR